MLAKRFSAPIGLLSRLAAGQSAWRRSRTGQFLFEQQGYVTHVLDVGHTQHLITQHPTRFDHTQRDGVAMR